MESESLVVYLKNTNFSEELGMKLDAKEKIKMDLLDSW
jgi:hypothetical protein